MVDLQAKSHTQSTYTFLTYHCIVFHMLSSSGSMIVTIKLKAEENIQVVAMLILQIQQDYLNKTDIFLKYTFITPS